MLNILTSSAANFRTALNGVDEGTPILNNLMEKKLRIE
jgi:hypothetical protein